MRWDSEPPGEPDLSGVLRFEDDSVCRTRMRERLLPECVRGIAAQHRPVESPGLSLTAQVREEGVQRHCSDALAAFTRNNVELHDLPMRETVAISP